MFKGFHPSQVVEAVHPPGSTLLGRRPHRGLSHTAFFGRFDWWFASQGEPGTWSRHSASGSQKRPGCSHRWDELQSKSSRRFDPGLSRAKKKNGLTSHGQSQLVHAAGRAAGHARPARCNPRREAARAKKKNDRGPVSKRPKPTGQMRLSPTPLAQVGYGGQQALVCGDHAKLSTTLKSKYAHQTPGA